MTASLSTAPPSRESARFRAPPAVVPTELADPALGDDVDTGIVALSPELLAAIRSIAPRRRRSKLPYVIAVALSSAAAAVSLDGPLRESIKAKASLLPGAAAVQGAVQTRP